MLVSAWGEGVLVIVGVGVGGISQRLRPRGEGGRRNGNPTNAVTLLSLAVVVDNSLALYAQLQFLLELRPREARPENSSIYIYTHYSIRLPATKSLKSTTTGVWQFDVNYRIVPIQLR